MSDPLGPGDADAAVEQLYAAHWRHLVRLSVLLVHDPALRTLLDRWVESLADDEFTDVLPLVRRTFGTFSPAQRRSLAQRLAHGDPVRASTGSDRLAALAGPALATVEAILAAGHRG